MIHNHKKNFFSFFFLILLITCKSFSFSNSDQGNFPDNFSGEYYQKLKILNANSFFEKNSSNYRFLVFAPDVKSGFKVKEIDISFFAYTNKFLEEVNFLFPEKAPFKYTIYEKIKYGVGKLKKDSTEIEVEYNNFTLRQSQSSDLLGGLEKFLNRKTEAQQLFKERITYSLTPDDGLWKGEEVLMKEEQGVIRWKNFQSGTVARNYPYTEFFPNVNTLEYSRINSFEDFSYKKIFKDIPSASKLYSNREYTIYYIPTDNFNPENQNIIKNKNLIIHKTEIPLIIYKKKESTSE